MQRVRDLFGAPSLNESAERRWWTAGTRRHGRRRWTATARSNTLRQRARDTRKGRWESQRPQPYVGGRRHLSSPSYARAVRIAAEPCGALVVRETAKALQLQTSAERERRYSNPRPPA